MRFVPMKEMLDTAWVNGYAVGQFNLNGLEFAQAFLQAAQEESSPIIIGVTEKAVHCMGGYRLIATMVESLMEEYEITVPVALHLDHSTSFESCMHALKAGFSSVMIDGSHLPLKQNTALTKKVVDAASILGVSVEGELGRITGEEDGTVVDTAEGKFAIPDECQRYVEESGVDCLAPALGSVHGFYQGKPDLQFGRMVEVRERTGVPLALHGGTGIPDEDIQRAIASGISKINVNTENQVAFTAAIRKALEEKPDLYLVRQYLEPAIEVLKKNVKEKMRLFDSVGQVKGKEKRGKKAVGSCRR
ncbi:class II fructose-1,6-bisphosphate aldolase [Kroppenstedtia pulmonis]|uniref:Class II fructose-1,6-bisphosphate aldolase n=1 Tax=Kroppenstedtia pulmonis TaxID=1380685 RepID=A0A7D3XQE8_9BACL|nr:class II fructose-1,6-bisphosphate aldolase [Kroppenstedtia pulmonis]QKG84727.1 class II fructose-1,6-bisphosphate aldolase [Kroppenstedtia pulmonis]